MRLTPITSQAPIPLDAASRDVHIPATLAHIAPTQSLDAARAQDDAMRSMRMARLVGARVPGGIDFSGANPTPRGPAIPLYRRPADMNAVATRIAAPIVDVTA